MPLPLPLPAPLQGPIAAGASRVERARASHKPTALFPDYKACECEGPCGESCSCVKVSRLLPLLLLVVVVVLAGLVAFTGAAAVAVAVAVAVAGVAGPRVL